MKAFLEGQDAYTLYKPVKRHFPRLKVRVNSLDELWDIDLAQVTHNNVSVNDNVRYLLIAIDILSRYLWVAPLQNKKPESVLEGFNVILKEGRTPKKIRVDKGKEFEGVFKDYVTKQGIKLIVTQIEDIKANYAERVIRTLRSLTLMCHPT